uniref:Uncharacterized protein n=1 Tax=Magallana gigas TaxID=29159 RepID=K1RIU6_MAGGI
MCLPCKDLSLHKDDDIWNFVEFTVTTDDKGQEVCCADTQEELQNLVKLTQRLYIKVEFLSLSRKYLCRDVILTGNSARNTESFFEYYEVIISVVA